MICGYNMWICEIKIKFRHKQLADEDKLLAYGIWLFPHVSAYRGAISFVDASFPYL